MRTLRGWACLLVALSFAWASAAPTDAEVQSRYKALFEQVRLSRLAQTYKDLSSAQTRLAGTPGERTALAYAEAEFRRLGMRNIRREPFKVTIPDPEAVGALTASSGAWTATVWPVWPNLVRPATCDVAGPLIYVGDGSLEALGGKALKGAIVLMEFNSGANWRNPAKLGAKAIVFIQPANMPRAEAEHKFSTVPLRIPRFYLPLDQAGPVMKAAFAGETVSLRCKQNWVERGTYNLLADMPGTDTKASDEKVVLFTYADSTSVIPKLSPGADSLGGLAAMLELARVMQREPRRRPLTFVVSGAHFASLQGAREFVERRLTEESSPLLLTVTLDIDSGSPALGSFGRGWFYEYRDETQEPLRNISRTLRQHADHIAVVQGTTPKQVLVDAVNSSDGRVWKNNIPSKFAFDCEPFVLARYSALTLATINTGRERCDTPFDVLSEVNLRNVQRQTQTIACLLHHILNDTTDRIEPSRHKVALEPTEPSRVGLTTGFSTLEGRVAIYDPRKSFVPDVTVPGSIVTNITWQKTLLGVRGTMLQLASGPEAAYRFLGVPPISAFPRLLARPTVLGAYKIDEGTGEVIYAPQFGAFGDDAYPLFFELKQAYRVSPIVVFPCRAVDFYDIFDPQELRFLESVRMTDADSDATPREFSLYWGIWDMRMSSEVEHSFVAFGPEEMRFKLVFGSEYGETRLPLINATSRRPEGEGHSLKALLDGGGLMPLTSLQAARDLVILNGSRIAQFAKYRIIAEGVNGIHRQAQESLSAAQEAEKRKDWAGLEKHARASWAYGLRVHPVVKKTAGDVVNGVLFYLFLLIPFSYFLERLFFGNRILTKQLVVAMAIFVGVFILLRYIHPAFEIVTNPSMIFVGFVMGALSLLVITFILGKFETSLKTLKQAESGIHEVDIGRVSVAMAAFNLGISNMRRRKARTFLTTLTLVVMTFIVLSFTSIVPELQLNETPSDTQARYTGMLVRMPGLEPLEISVYRVLHNEFGDSAAVARRSWYFGAEVGETSVISVYRADRSVDARAIVGMEAIESKISRPQEALLPGGRWFEPGDTRAIILPRPMAETLKVRGSEIGKAKVVFDGEEYVVVGVFDPSLWRELIDLDGDELLPADFALSKRFQMEENTGTEAFRRFVRLEPSTIVLMPSQTAQNLGATIRSVAVGFDDPAKTRKALDSLMPRLRLNLYASVPAEGGLEVRQFSVMQGSKGTGLALVLIQLLIAAVFVLNTMIASVFERTKEISIFSAIGLAPNHIAMLFFAESLVYGVLGAVSGYIAAQTVAKIVVATGAFPGLYLNFSSVSAVMAAGLVMAVVLLSTIYPARKAARIAAPALNEDAFKKEPDGDEWTIELPFNVSVAEAAPLVEFFGEWLAAYEEYTIGDFVTSGTVIRSLSTDHGPAFEAETTAWVAPYDLGVSQTILLRAKPTRIKDIYALDLVLTRLGGEPANWVTVNRRFLASLRKQFLTWRTLDAEKRAGYVERASATLAPAAGA